MSPRLAPGVAVSLALVLALSGCTTSGTPTSTGTGAAPTPTAEPTVQPQSVPESTIPLTCSDVLTEAEASDILQFDVTAKVTESTVRRLWMISGHQVGMLSCVWGGEGMTDNSWNESIELNILPNADADWQVGVWQVDDGAVVYPAGSTTSEYQCSAVDSNMSLCYVNVLVNGYWAQARASARGLDEGRTMESASQSMRTLVDSLTATISSAGGPRASWVEPQGALQGAYCPPTVVDASSQRYPAAVAETRAHFVTCDYGDGWSVQVQPGGAWAVDGFVGNELSYSIKNAEAASLPGTDAGAWGCADECYGVYAVRDSAVGISGPVVDKAQFDAQATEILAAVVAAG